MGKTSKRRPCLISREEEEIRWALFQGRITRAVFDKKMKKLHIAKTDVKPHN